MVGLLVRGVPWGTRRGRAAPAGAEGHRPVSLPQDSRCPAPAC